MPKKESVTPELVAVEVLESANPQTESNEAELFNPVPHASYGDLFERLTDFTFMVREDDFRILAVNPAAERFLGKSAGQLTGHFLMELAVEEDQAEFRTQLRRARRKYYPMRFETRWNGEEGTSSKIMEILACLMKLKDEREVLQVIARDITYQREMERKLEELSLTDELTKLANKRQFKQSALLEHERCSRYHRPYAIVLCDLDHFKNYNDTHGHPAGDRLLAQLGEVIQSACRQSDLPARYGGEEFIILCTETNASEALTLAERICTMVREFAFEHAADQPLGHVSVSVGVAGFPENGKELQSIIEAADAALYLSKGAGRDRVTLAKGEDMDALKKESVATQKSATEGLDLFNLDECLLYGFLPIGWIQDGDERFLRGMVINFEDTQNLKRIEHIVETKVKHAFPASGVELECVDSGIFWAKLIERFRTSKGEVARRNPEEIYPGLRA